jgi:hypothetical protein
MARAKRHYIPVREPAVSYPNVFGTKNAYIDPKNSYFWNINPDIST